MQPASTHQPPLPTRKIDWTSHIVTVVLALKVIGHEASNSGQYHVVVSTWPFVEAVRASWRAVDNGFSVVDSVVEGCPTCEELRCDVGLSGSSDENGETTFDALIIDGVSSIHVMLVINKKQGHLLQWAQLMRPRLLLPLPNDPILNGPEFENLWQ